MRGSRKFCPRGSKFDNFFLVDDGIEDPNTAINGPSSARQRNAISAIIGPPAKPHWNGVSLAGRWWPTLNAGLVALWYFRGFGPELQRNPICLWFSRGGGPDPLSSPLNPPMPYYLHQRPQKYIRRTLVVNGGKEYQCIRLIIDHLLVISLMSLIKK